MKEQIKDLKILYLEDSEQDAELTGRVLRKAGIPFTFRLVDEQEEYERALREYQPDLVLSDHSLFQFNSLEALRIFKSFNFRIPFILVTGTVSEEFAVNILKEGANDYLLKNNLARLPSAILNALEKTRVERERQQYLDNIIANEALLKEAEHLAHFGSWEMDITANSTKWSDEAFRIYGYEPGEIQPDIQTFIKHVHPDEVEELKKRLNEAVENRDSFECEFRIIDKQGRVKHLNLKMVFERNSASRPVRLIGFIHDITEQKEAQENLLKSFQEVAKLEKELAEQRLVQQKLITEVTIQAQEKERNELGKELHDNINQILSTVKMYLSLLIDVKKQDEGLIRRSHQLLNDAVEEIRKLSKTLVTPTLGDMGLAEALKEMADEVSALSGLKFELHLHIQEKKGDPNIDLMLYRIAQEQINNVLKYSKARKVVMTLNAGPTNIFLSISDNGVGFDPKKKAKGIGLKNILSRVEFYSGKLDILSAPGKGCTIEVTIPL
jgi:two-component system sensor histidine kinase UhpB